MDVAEVEENLFTATDAKLHGQMCKTLSIIYCKVLSVFPSLEAARPRSKSGIQALCSLHVALEKVKNVLQHCSECSKLYLAITADSVLLKFEKAKSALEDSLRRVEEIVPQSIGCQVQEIVNEFVTIEFALDPSEKQVGNDLIALLQQGRKFNDSSDSNELECFHQAATRLGITSSRAALAERRALKKLLERARSEEDKRKESIIAYLLHLMRKYSKLFRSEFSDDNDSQGSAPCSPTVQGSIGDSVPGSHCQAFDRQLSKFSCFNFKPNSCRKSGQMPLPPEELRCPISLQLMYDPVIIASGQTYERVCIEKWFSDGHNKCPKTQQKLSHLCLTPNYCVKGLVTSWCEQNGVPIPEGPPESLDLNYWQFLLSESESTNSKSVDSVNSCKLKGVDVVSLEESGIPEESVQKGTESVSAQEEDTEQYFNFLKVLTEGNNWRRQCEVVEQLRLLLRDDEEARIFMGANGFVEALLQFLQSAVHEGSVMAVESGTMALFNLAVDNNRNKEIMLSAGVLSWICLAGGCVFNWGASELKGRLCGFKKYGFCNMQVVGICLAFPFVFDGQKGVEVEALFCDLRLLFGKFGLAGCVEEKGNGVDDWVGVCRKIRLFYELNGGKNIGEFIGGNNGVGVGVIVEHGEEELVQAIDYFCRFGAKKEDVARLIVNGPELLELELKTGMVNVMKLLKHFGISSNGVDIVRRDSAHVLGTVKMCNLPNVMRALGLHEWFFEKIKDGNHSLLVSFVASNPNVVRDKGYLDFLKTIQVSRTPTHNMSKLNFLHAIGFGENALTMNIFSYMHGTSDELQRRFDCLLHLGIEFSKVCKMITIHPKILSQNPESLEQKINFLCQEMGHSLENLVTFPSFLCFDLENRIKPRHRFHSWIMEKGLSSKRYSIASMVATSNRNFVARAFKIHPAAPKHWFEQFYL